MEKVLPILFGVYLPITPVNSHPLKMPDSREPICMCVWLPCCSVSLSRASKRFLQATLAWPFRHGLSWLEHEVDSWHLGAWAGVGLLT